METDQFGFSYDMCFHKDYIQGFGPDGSYYVFEYFAMLDKVSTDNMFGGRIKHLDILYRGRERHATIFRNDKGFQFYDGPKDEVELWMCKKVLKRLREHRCIKPMKDEYLRIKEGSSE